VRKRLIALVCVVAAGGAAAFELRGGEVPAPSSDVPTFVIQRVAFARRISADGTLRAVEATPVLAPQASEDSGALKVTWIATDGTAVKKGDVVMRFDAAERERALHDGRADLDSAASKLREENIKSSALVGGRDDDASLAAAELDQQRHFQPQDEALFARKVIIESQVDEHLAAAKQQHALQAETIEKRLSGAKAGVIGVDEAKAKLAISHAEKDLDSMVVRAPHDGIFVIENRRDGPTKIGDQLWPGQRFAEVPLLDNMEAELFVLEVDASGLTAGEPAEVVVEAHPDRVYTGKIRVVDSLAKKRIPGVPVRYFTTVVTLDRTDTAVMKPGQRVHGTLVLDREDALVLPREAIVDVSGKPYAYRRGATGFDRIAVELGAASAGRVVVKSGLAVGDVVALRDPTRAADDTGSAGSGAKP
jgi:HlyD family secretion protein